MANYGTIPTSSPISATTVNLDYLTRAKARLKDGLGTRRPWRELIELHSFGFPRSIGAATSRVKANVAYFRMNYAILVLLILFLSLLWHPISLIIFIVMMGVWLFLYFLRDEPLVIFGRLVNDLVVLIALWVLTIIVLLLTGATLNILVSLLVGVVVVLLHAAVRKTDDLPGDEEAAGASTS